MSCGAAVCGVACFVFCRVLCGVLVLGRVLAQCCPARCCARSCCGVFDQPCFCGLLCSLMFFFPALFLAFTWCSGLFLFVWFYAMVRLAVRRGPVALRSCAGFCCAVQFGALLCRGVSLGSVLCCLFRCGGSVMSCPVRCCGVLLFSVLGGGAVLSCCAICGPVVPCAVFLGASCFLAPLVRCCAGLAVLLLSVQSSLPPLALAAGVCCCLLCFAVCCSALLSSAFFWWVLVVPGVMFRCFCACPAAWLAALWFVAVCLGAPLPCIVACGAVLSSGGVLMCSSVCLRPCLCLLFVCCCKNHCQTGKSVFLFLFF